MDATLNVSRPRRVARRLYLSALALSLAFGVLVTGGLAVREIHDHIVTRRAFECFDPHLRAWVYSFPPGADMSDTSGLAGAEKVCGVERHRWRGTYVASAAWADGYLAASRWETVGFAALSFLPAAMLLVVAAWMRWLLR